MKFRFIGKENEVVNLKQKQTNYDQGKHGMNN